MSVKIVNDYYLKKKKILIRTFDAALLIGKQILIDTFGEQKYNEISITTHNEFEALLPQIPYIGGDDKPLTDDLINATILLPLIRVFKKKGLEYREIGRIVYELFEAFYKVIPQADDIFSEEYISNAKERANDSKSRQYPGDWVFDFIKGDGKTFTFGIDYSECGVYKFYKSQGAEDFMPLVCIADYAQARAYGYGLKRTQSIGNGDDVCDFRYLKNGTTPRAWPPDNLQEFKMKL